MPSPIPFHPRENLSELEAQLCDYAYTLTIKKLDALAEIRGNRSLYVLARALVRLLVAVAPKLYQKPVKPTLKSYWARYTSLLQRSGTVLWTLRALPSTLASGTYSKPGLTAAYTGFQSCGFNEVKYIEGANELFHILSLAFKLVFKDSPPTKIRRSRAKTPKPVLEQIEKQSDKQIEKQSAHLSEEGSAEASADCMTRVDENESVVSSHKDQLIQRFYEREGKAYTAMPQVDILGSVSFNLN